jgi:hypothetical protein
MATATATRSRYGRWGRRLRIFDTFQGWAADPKVQEAIQEAETRADFAEFLMGAIRTATLRGYQYAAPQWDRYMGVESAQDFREHRAKGLSGMSGIHHLGELGEYKEMRRARRPVVSYAVDTYGATYSLSRHLIINDDMKQILSSTPEEMGKAMGRFVTRTAVALIESNPNYVDGAPVFSATRGNEVTDPLSEDSLANLFTWMENQLDENGDEITLTPNVLAVKTLKLQLIAKRIVRSQETGTTINYTGGGVGVGTASFDKGTYNPLFNMLDPDQGVIRDPYFQDPNDYYLFADPGENPAFIMAFLNGERDPYVGLKNPETRSALPSGTDDPYTFEMDTIDFKIRHDFGAAVVDFRGAARGRVP